MAGAYHPQPLPPFGATAGRRRLPFHAAWHTAPACDQARLPKLHRHGAERRSRHASARGSARSRTRSSSAAGRSTTSIRTSARARVTGCTSLLGGAGVTGSSTTPGHLKVGVLVRARRNVAPVPPDPHRRARAHGAVHSRGAMTRVALLLAAVAACDGHRAVRARGRRPCERLPARAEGLPLVRARLLPTAGACADEARRAGKQAGLHDPRRGHRQRVRPRLRHRALAQAADVREVPWRGAAWSTSSGCSSSRRTASDSTGQHSPKAGYAVLAKLHVKPGGAGCSHPPPRPSRRSPKQDEGARGRRGLPHRRCRGAVRPRRRRPGERLLLGAKVFLRYDAKFPPTSPRS